MHNGRSRDGRLLYAAFPYPSYTRLTRADSDALYAHVRSLAPVKQANRRHELNTGQSGARRRQWRIPAGHCGQIPGRLDAAFRAPLDDDDIAAVLTYIRGAWGHQASAVTPLDVLRYR